MNKFFNLVLFTIFCWATSSLALANNNGELSCQKLLAAIHAEDQAAIRTIIQNGFDINSICLTRSGLIEAGREVPMTPLMIAIEKGSITMVNLLLSENADIDRSTIVEDLDRKTRLLLPGNVSKASFDGIERIEIYPLLLSVIMQNQEMVDFLLKNGAKPDIRHVMLTGSSQKTFKNDRPSRSSYYPIQLAKLLKNNHIVLKLMEYEVDLETDGYYHPPYVLSFLILNGAAKEEIAKALELKADVNYKLNPTPIGSAAARGDIEIFDLLLANGAEINLRPKNFQESQGLYSAAATNLEMIRHLKKIGLKPMKTWFFGSTISGPINGAIFGEDLEAINELIDIGFDPDQKGSSSWAPIHFLAKGRQGPRLVNPKALEVLVKKGADVNITFDSPCSDYDPPCDDLEKEGNVTPLMYAAYEHEEPYETIKILVQNGAGKNMKTKKSGFTASDIWQARIQACNSSYHDRSEAGRKLYPTIYKSICSFSRADEVSTLLN